jgi:DNA-binding transcriptional LysR family regulator
VISRKLEYLIALAQHSHFARAAAACQVSQPALSAAIQQLEIEFGVQIVKRGRRFQGFTEQGEIILEWARNTATECERLHEKLRDRNENFSGTLRIGVLGSTIPLLKIITIPFQERYPNTNLRVMCHSAFDIEQAAEGSSSSLDVVMTYMDQTSHRYSRSHVLYSEEYELLIRRGTQYAGQKSVPWEAIRAAPLCLLSPDSSLFGTEESEILNDALSKTPHIITNAIWLVMDHVRSGKWASVLPRPVRIMISGDNELEAIPLPKTGTPTSIGIAIPRQQAGSKLAEAFFEVATSDVVLRKIHDFLYPTGTVQRDKANGKLLAGQRRPDTTPPSSGSFRRAKTVTRS